MNDDPFRQIFWAYIKVLYASIIITVVLITLHAPFPRLWISLQLLLMAPSVVGTPLVTLLLLIRERRVFQFGLREKCPE